MTYEHEGQEYSSGQTFVVYMQSDFSAEIPNTGVCSSYTQSDLWRMSVENGSNQSWDEFRGYASRRAVAVETTAGTGAGSFIPTCGSVF